MQKDGGRSKGTEQLILRLQDGNFFHRQCKRRLGRLHELAQDAGRSCKVIGQTTS